MPLPDDAELVLVLMEPGDVLFFNGSLVHGSKSNRSDRFRRALIGHYIQGDAREVAHWCHRGKPDERWHSKWRKGDFGLWNELKERGHHVMPHGYGHVNKADVPFAEAKRLIEACLDVFRAKLAGFEGSEASFAFPYNRSSPEIENWLSGRVRAFRTGGDPVMPLPRRGQQRVTCVSFGPERRDDHLCQTIDSFLAGRPGWLCYNVHGLDDEGWGPLESDTLDRLLEDLVARDVRVLPITAALDLAVA